MNEHTGMPEPDYARIARDEARGIKFSDDKRTLLEYDSLLEDREYTIPSGVTGIGDRAFICCEGLKRVNIPCGVTAIGRGAFEIYGRVIAAPDHPVFYNDDRGALIDRKQKKILHLPSDVVGEYAIPDDVTIIGDFALRLCGRITNVKIHDKVTTIGDYALAGCPLESITIPPGVTVIGEGALLGDGRTECERIVIPASVRKIGDKAFSAQSVIVAPGNPFFYNDAYGALIDRERKRILYLPFRVHGKYVIPDGVTTIGDRVFDTFIYLTEVVIPDGVTSIGESAFKECCFTQMKIPDSVTVIGDHAFEQCIELELTNMPANVTTIGESAFYNCRSLAALTFPDCVTTIGKMAFAYCSKLPDIHLPSSVTTIGDGAFAGCGKVIAAPGHPVFYNDDAGALIDRRRKMFLHLPRDFSGSYVIPDGVTDIGPHAFDQCAKLERITIPSGVTDIGKSAFSNCTGLTDVTLPDGVETIGENAFWKCSNLTQVTLPDSLKFIASCAFFECMNLTHQEIPESTTFARGAFAQSPCEEQLKRDYPQYFKSEY